MKYIKKFISALKPRFTASLLITLISAVVITVIYINGCKNVIPAIIILICDIVLTMFVFGYFKGKKVIADDDSVVFTGLSLDYLAKTGTPVLICNGNEKILWSNNAFDKKINVKHRFGERFSELFGLNPNNLASYDDEKGSSVVVEGKEFYVRGYSFSSDSKKYYITTWEDRSEINILASQYKDNETFIAYIVADNIDELAANSRDGVKTASLELDNILKTWAAENNCVIREYSNERYIVLLNSISLKSFIDNKFEILDKVRNINIGSENISLTVSVGIGRVSGTLSDKERFSGEALDMALQRGGDQAVIKTDSEMLFFGGKTQAVQKKTKIRSRVIVEELCSHIVNSSDVLIMGHKTPDYDAIGAAVGIGKICRYCQKPFRIVIDADDKNLNSAMKILNGVNEYTDDSLFISPEDVQEQLKSTTLVVCVDFNNKQQAPVPELIDFSNRIVYIDHHRKTAEFPITPLTSYIEPSSSSTCELVAEMLENILPAGSLSSSEAEMLYAGILLDTKQFTRNAGVRTFGAALYLRNEGANPSEVQKLFKKSLDNFISESGFGANLSVYMDYFAIATDKKCNDRITASRVADNMLGIENIKASFAVSGSDGNVNISCRSLGEINVQLIAERLGGGGRFDASAAHLNVAFEEAVVKLKSAIDRYIKDYSN